MIGKKVSDYYLFGMFSDTVMSPKSGWIPKDFGCTSYLIHFSPFYSRFFILTAYEMKIDFEGFSELREDYYLSEQNIYGSSRIGMIKSYIKIGERIFNGNFSGDIQQH